MSWTPRLPISWVSGLVGAKVEVSTERLACSPLCGARYQFRLFLIAVGIPSGASGSQPSSGGACRRDRCGRRVASRCCHPPQAVMQLHQSACTDECSVQLGCCRRCHACFAAGPALVSPATAAKVQLSPAATAACGRGFLCLAEGSDCVLPVAVDDSIADGRIAVNSVQQHNLHLGVGIRQDFRQAPCFFPPACFYARQPIRQLSSGRSATHRFSAASQERLDRAPCQAGQLQAQTLRV